VSQTYETERWTLTKDAILAAQGSLTVGIENSEELLADYDLRFGRDTRSNRLNAERMEQEIERMKSALKGLTP